MNWKHDSHNVIPPISFRWSPSPLARRPETAVVYTATHSLVRLLQVSFFTSCCTSISRLYQNDGHFFLFFLWIYISKNYISSFATRTIERTSKETSNQQTQFILFFSLVLYFCYMVLQHQISFVSNSIPLWNAEICMQKKGLLILCKHRIMNVGSRCNDVCYPFVCCTIDSAFKTHNYERRE